MYGEIIKSNFETLKKNRINASFALSTVKTSNLCISIFNNTKEGNIFNICRQSIYMRCIVDIRKILEPHSSEKTANLQYVIEKMYQNKELFGKQHYNDTLEMYNKGKADELSAYRCEMAQLESNRCLKRIELVNHRWNKFWKLLSESASFQFIRDSRDHLVHSLNATNIFMPPMYKVEKILNIILWFIKQLDYIIYNSSSNYDELDKQAERVALNFWSYMKKN